MSDDPDFRQRMHFMGPAGFLPCTRAWPHDGPCAHREIGPTYYGKVGRWISLEWYDGPILEIARVEYDDGEPPLVEVRTYGWEDRDEPDKIHVRFTREDLVRMLDCLDGRPVMNYRDELEGS